MILKNIKKEILCFDVEIQLVTHERSVGQVDER